MPTSAASRPAKLLVCSANYFLPVCGGGPWAFTAAAARFDGASPTTERQPRGAGTCRF